MDLKAPLAPHPISTDKADMPISSPAELEKWLNKQGRADWAQVIAARAALRVLPYAFAERIDQKWFKDFASPLIRASAISWVAPNFPAHNMVAAAYAAAARANHAAFTADGADTSAAAFAAADAAAAAAAAAAPATHVASAYAARTASTYAARAAFWENINHDCEWLADEGAPSTAARHLTRVYLWPEEEPEGWGAAWDYAITCLRNLDQGYDVWIDWYNRRIEGYDSAFDIPGDINRAEDKAILARLADATDQGFWGRGATYVNTTLQRWIDEARERVRESEAEPAEPEAQNTDVIQFRQTENGQFDPDFNAGSGELLADQAACDRHHAFVTTAKEALSLCQGHNQIGHIAEHLTIVVEAAGDHPVAMRVDLLVARGERMVDDLGDAVKELQPNPDVPLDNLREKRIVNVFRALIRDYTAMIKLDPALDRRQRLPHEDDEPHRSAVLPQQAIIFVNSSVIVGAITQSSRDIIVEGARGLPENGDAIDRKVWRFAETVRNLPRAMISFLWQYRGAIVGGIAATITGLGTASMALITQEAAIRSFFATNPGMLSIIDELVTLLRGIGT